MRGLEVEEQDRAERRVQVAQHSSTGTRDETTADKEDQRGHAEREPLWCEWVVLTVVEDGATASPQLKKFASHVEQSRRASPRVTSSPRRTKLDPEEELADMTKRVEHLHAMVRHNGRRQRNPVRPEENERAATNDAAEEWKTTLHGRD